MAYEDGLEGLEGVQPESPSGTEDHELEPDQVVDEPTGSEDDEKKKDEGRDLDNIHREFARKQNAFEERITSRLESVVDRLRNELRSSPAPASEPVGQGGNQLDKLPLEQLRNMRSQIPEEQKEAFEDYLIERVIKEQTTSFEEKFTQQHQTDLKRREANQKAMNRYPDLADKTSDLYKAVAAEMRSRGGREYVAKSPTAVLDVASSVASDLGVMPATAPRKGPRAKPHQPTARRGSRPVDARSGDETITDEKVRAISDRLRGLIPGIKLDEKKIKEKHKVYKDNQNLFVR